MRYGFIVTTYNDGDDAIRMFDSLKKSIPEGDSYKICIVDGGSTEEERAKITGNIGAIDYTHKDLSSALNGGIYKLLGYQPDGSNIEGFVENPESRSVDYIIWIHTDCIFFQHDWTKKLISVYEHVYPLVGRMHPGTSNIDSSIQSLQQGEALRSANSCPVLFGWEIIHELLENDGFVYDPQYIKIGSCEDIDCWQRLHQLGYMSCICSLVDVHHIGAGIRSRTDTNADQIHNRTIYHKRWSDGVWGNQLGPKADYDLSEVNKELMEKFDYLAKEVIDLIPVRNKITEEVKEFYYERTYNK